MLDIRWSSRRPRTYENDYDDDELKQNKKKKKKKKKKK